MSENLKLKINLCNQPIKVWNIKYDDKYTFFRGSISAGKKTAYNEWSHTSYTFNCFVSGKSKNKFDENVKIGMRLKINGNISFLITTVNLENIISKPTINVDNFEIIQDLFKY